MNAQQRAVLRQSKVARNVHARFTEGVRVRAIDGDDSSPQGTVARHIPMMNAQGGTIVVDWPNGTTGRHSAGDLTILES